MLPNSRVSGGLLLAVARGPSPCCAACAAPRRPCGAARRPGEPSSRRIVGDDLARCSPAAPAAQQILLSTPGGASGEFHRAWSSNEDWERVQRSPPINARASPRRLRRRLADPNLASQSVAIYTGSLPRRRARRRAFNGLEGDELSFALDQDDRCGVKLPGLAVSRAYYGATDINRSEYIRVKQPDAKWPTLVCCDRPMRVRIVEPDDRHSVARRDERKQTRPVRILIPRRRRLETIGNVSISCSGRKPRLGPRHYLGEQRGAHHRRGREPEVARGSIDRGLNGLVAPLPPPHHSAFDAILATAIAPR